MWTTGASHMIARLTGSTLFANHNVISILAFDQHSLSTTTSSSDNVDKNWNVITKMRDLRARSPYALFIKDNYSELSAKYPDLKLVDISKKAAEVWKALPDEKKQTYQKKSQDQKINYDQQKKNLSANDLQTVDANEKARRIENRVKKSIQQLPTKRPRTAYVHFLLSLDRGEADLRDFMKGAAQRWSQMTVEDKQKFEELHQEEKQNYVKALVAWDSSNNQKSKPTTSVKTKDGTVKKTRGTSATGKRVMKKRTIDPSKPAVSAAKSSKTKSSKATSDKESSSSDDEPSTKTTKSTKS